MLRMNQKQFKFAVAVIGILYFALLCVFAHGKTLWFDDVCQINMVYKCSLQDAISNIREYDNNPPASHLLSFLWIELAPYGTAWLKLPSIVFVTIAIVLIAFTADNIYGEVFGILSMVAGCSLGIIVERAAYTFRPYGLFFFASALVLYLYEKKNKPFDIGYVVALIILVYSHYFGILLVIGLFCDELVKNIRKKDEFLLKRFCQYAIAGISIFPWLIYVMNSSLSKAGGFWTSKPGIIELCGTLPLLLDFDVVIIAIILVQVINIIARARDDKDELYLVAIPTGIMIVVFMFSRITELSLFVTRYFICLVPIMLILFAGGCKTIYEFGVKHNAFMKLDFGKILLMAFIIYSFLNITVYLQGHWNNAVNPYEKVADSLNVSSDLREGNVAVLDVNTFVPRGWEYFLTQKGKLSMPRVVESVNDVDLEINKIYVVNAQFPDKDINDFVTLGEEWQLEQKSDELPISVYVR